MSSYKSKSYDNYDEADWDTFYEHEVPKSLDDSEELIDTDVSELPEAELNHLIQSTRATVNIKPIPLRSSIVQLPNLAIIGAVTADQHRGNGLGRSKEREVSVTSADGTLKFTSWEELESAENKFVATNYRLRGGIVVGFFINLKLVAYYIGPETSSLTSPLRGTFNWKGQE